MLFVLGQNSFCIGKAGIARLWTEVFTQSATERTLEDRNSLMGVSARDRMMTIHCKGGNTRLTSVIPMPELLRGVKVRTRGSPETTGFSQNRAQAELEYFSALTMHGTTRYRNMIE